MFFFIFLGLVCVEFYVQYWFSLFSTQISMYRTKYSADCGSHIILCWPFYSPSALLIQIGIFMFCIDDNNIVLYYFRDGWNICNITCSEVAVCDFID